LYIIFSDFEELRGKDKSEVVTKRTFNITFDKDIFNTAHIKQTQDDHSDGFETIPQSNEMATN